MYAPFLDGGRCVTLPPDRRRAAESLGASRRRSRREVSHSSLVGSAETYELDVYSDVRSDVKFFFLGASPPGPLARYGGSFGGRDEVRHVVSPASLPRSWKSRRGSAGRETVRPPSSSVARLHSLARYTVQLTLS